MGFSRLLGSHGTQGLAPESYGMVLSMGGQGGAYKKQIPDQGLLVACSHWAIAFVKPGRNSLCPSSSLAHGIGQVFAFLGMTTFGSVA